MRERRLGRRVVGLAVVTAVTWAPLAWGGAGDLDDTFAGSGKVTTDLPSATEQSRASAVGEDGSVFAAGWATGENDPSGDLAFAVVKYTPAGELDDSFSDDGYLNASLSKGSDTATAILVQPDHSVLVAGQIGTTRTHLDFGVIRVLPDGTVDSSFGEAGLARVDFGRADYPYDLGLDDSGRIVVAGMAGGRLGMTRLLSDGALDTSFGEDGIAEVRFGGSLEAATVAPDGGVVAAGSSDAAGCGSGFRVLRVRRTGVAQTAFSEDGKTTFCVGRFDGAQAAAVQNNGDVVVAGQAGPYPQQIGVARLRPNGELDDSFSTDGKVTSRLPGDAAEIRGILIDRGRPVVGGYGVRSGRDLPFVVRYTPRGSLDADFGRDGVLRVPFKKHGTAWSISEAPDRRAVITGGRGQGQSEITAARFELGH